MLASITPLGERGRHNRFAITASAYLLGSTLGGLTIGASAGALGWLLVPSGRLVPELVAGLVFVAAAVAVLFDLRLGGLRLPTVHRQVNEDWLTAYRGWIYGVGFGFQLGLGVITIVTTAAVYAALVDAVLTGSVLGGAAIGLAFGLVRGATIFLGARVQRPEQLNQLHRRFASRSRAATRVTVTVQALVAATSAAILLGAP
jgi:sulfite exporter TauE/SafE